MRDFIHLESADDVALFLDDAFRKVAPQKLSDIDSNGVAVFERSGGAHRRLAHHDRTIGFDDFQQTDPLVVIAKNLQQHIATCARRK